MHTKQHDQIEQDWGKVLEDVSSFLHLYGEAVNDAQDYFYLHSAIVKDVEQARRHLFLAYEKMCGQCIHDEEVTSDYADEHFARLRTALRDYARGEGREVPAYEKVTND